MKAKNFTLDPAVLRERLFGRKPGRSRKDGGFSMIEIMVAMAIIAILALGIAPQFGKYFERAAVQNMTGVLDNASQVVQNDLSLTGKVDIVAADITTSLGTVNKGTTTLTSALTKVDGTASAAGATKDKGFMLVSTDTEVTNFKAVFCSTGPKTGIRVIKSTDPIYAAPTCV